MDDVLGFAAPFVPAPVKHALYVHVSACHLESCMVIPAGMGAPHCIGLIIIINNGDKPNIVMCAPCAPGARVVIPQMSSLLVSHMLSHSHPACPSLPSSLACPHAGSCIAAMTLPSWAAFRCVYEHVQQQCT